MPRRNRRSTLRPYRLRGLGVNTRSVDPSIPLVDSQSIMRAQGSVIVQFNFDPSGTPLSICDVALNTGISTRLEAYATTYEQYRFTRLRCVYGNTLFNGSSVAQDTALCFVPGNYKTGPTNYNSVVETGTAVAVRFSEVTVPTVLNIPRKTLISQQQLKWFNTFSTGLEQNQGTLFMAATSTGATVVDCRIEFICEFCSPCYAGDEALIMGLERLLKKTDKRNKNIAVSDSESKVDSEVDGCTFVSSPLTSLITGLVPSPEAKVGLRSAPILGKVLTLKR
jgi:hypothetical protein